ncbi:AraC family transcriptional regulator [Chryseobacterium sp. T16E-39]|uniref:helix-turn-helix domain-containing protein n=1 Tax=Chryseobacterium sp. T16E-39 TaxID=2015076 RepID=UPI000B5B37F5|nr:helix-turn-helix domain-containing protein [Chryseobacterium sp. T16E-39]ASK29376.1 AraC family transcriptional regulator [Chryseobacterium sp. T16E-39]
MKDIPIRHISRVQEEPYILGGFTIKEVNPVEDMIQPLHRHDFYYILALEKGIGEHEIDFVRYTIDDYTVFIMRPGQVHQLVLKTGSTGYLIQCKADFLYSHNNASKNHLNKVSATNFYPLNREGFEKIQTLLQQSFKEFTTKDKGYQEVLKANLSVFLIEILRQRDIKSGPQTTQNFYAQEKLEKFLDLIAQHHVDHKHVSYYTDVLNLSSYQLSSITKSLLSKTPSEVINDYIILEAKRQLLATSNQVSQIALNLGYEDVSYFIRFFKRHLKCSPAIFRQNFK